MNKNAVIGIVIVALGILGYLIFRSVNENVDNPVVSTFEDCALAGYPIAESFPRQCRTPDGRIFVEEGVPPAGATATGGCFIGGCSQQLCTDQADANSTCEYREEYACYQTGRCERQADGACGWTQTPELLACLTISNNILK